MTIKLRATCKIALSTKVGQRVEELILIFAKQTIDPDVNSFSRDLHDLYATLDNASQSPSNNRKVSRKFKN